jgi:hypothetical protein
VRQETVHSVEVIIPNAASATRLATAVQENPLFFQSYITNAPAVRFVYASEAPVVVTATSSDINVLAIVLPICLVFLVCTAAVLIFFFYYRNKSRAIAATHSDDAVELNSSRPRPNAFYGTSSATSPRFTHVFKNSEIEIVEEQRLPE